MTLWMVKSARYYYGQAGWFAYRYSDFVGTSSWFATHGEAIDYAQHRARIEDSIPEGWH